MTPLPRDRATTEAGIPIFPGVVTAILVGLVYLLIASGGTLHFKQSLYPHHVLIADAWLHGQLYARDAAVRPLGEAFFESVHDVLEGRLAARGGSLSESDWQRLQKTLAPPPVMHDWSVFEGQLYSYFGPMPALLLLPYVALIGPTASDMLVSCLLGMGTVFLMYLVLRQAHRRRLIEATTPLCVALSLLLGLGTVQFYLVVMGQVWFLSQVTTTFFLALAMYLILQTTAGVGWPLAAGAAFAAAILSRQPILMTIGFFYLVLRSLADRPFNSARRQLMAQAIAFSAPIIVAAALAAALNRVRFGNLFESGSGFQQVTSAIQPLMDRYVVYGALSWRYLPRNVFHYFINPTLVRQPHTNAISFDPQGNSTFLVTPALLYIFRAYKRDDWFVRALWLGVGGLMMTLLLFVGGGAVQFGSRYVLDLMPLAIILVAIGMRGRLTRTAAALIGLSMAVNAWGTYRFWIENGTAATTAVYVAVAQANHAATFYTTANTLMTEGKTDEAVEQFGQALRVAPDSAEIHNSLGNALLAQRKLAEAIAQYAAALRLRPAYPEAQNNLGTALAAQGKTGEAVEQLEQALRLNPTYAEAHYNLATVLLRERRLDEAKAHFAAAIQQDPNHAAAHNNLGFLLFEQGRRADAIAEYREALRIKPDYPDAHVNLGVALAASGQTAEAITHYESALRLQPDHAAAHRNLGAALAQQGDPARAIAELQAALALNPDDSEARQRLAQLNTSAEP